MTIRFTLPYSSGGCEERRIKFDLLTAIIKRSLLASIKAGGANANVPKPSCNHDTPARFLLTLSLFSRAYA